MITPLTTSRPGRYDRIPYWVRDLEFVTDFFSWLFALFTRLAEPLMLVSTLYLVAEQGVPTIAQPALHNLALGLMITAPEIILPGSFVVASRSQQHRRLLYGVCWTFIGLTTLTLISLFVWHFQGAALAWLMCVRCAAAFGYSILMRVMNHGNVGGNVVSEPAKFPDVAEQVAQSVRDAVREQTPQLPAAPARSLPVENFGVFPAGPVALEAAYGGFTFMEFPTESEPESEHLSEPESEQGPNTDKIPVAKLALAPVNLVNLPGNKRPARKQKQPPTSAKNDVAAARVRRVIAANQDSSIADIMKKANVSKGYASKVRAAVLSGQQVAG